MSSSASAHMAANQILSALPRSEYPLLFSNLRPVSLDRGKVLYDLGDPIRSVFFVMSGMVSLLATTGDGSTTQVGRVGDEGVVGIAAILKISHAPYGCQRLTQLPPTGRRPIH
jgi:CRP-like cAMP-binding protein